MLFDFLSARYFGSTLEQYFIFFGVVMLSIVLGRIAYFIIQKYGSKLTAKTKNQFDDLVIEALEKPMIYGGFIAGLFFGFQFLSPNVDFVNNNYQKAIQALIILDFAWLCLKLVDGFIDHFVMPLAAKTKTALDDQLVPIIRKILKLGIAIVTIVIILSSFGIDVLPLLAGLGIGGLAIAFAAQKTVEDVFGGISIFTGKPFTIGDTVRVKGIEGDVENIGIRYTRIRDGDGRLITIPNGMVAQDVMMNISSEKTRRFQLTLGLRYGTSAKKIDDAMKILKKIAEDNPKVDPRETRAVLRNFSPSSIDIWFVYFVKDKRNAFDVASEVNLEVMRRFEKAGIAFAFPTQTVHIESMAKRK